jgi:hypothetical protein
VGASSAAVYPRHAVELRRAVAVPDRTVPSPEKATTARTRQQQAVSDEHHPAGLSITRS